MCHHGRLLCVQSKRAGSKQPAHHVESEKRLFGTSHLANPGKDRIRLHVWHDRHTSREELDLE